MLQESKDVSHQLRNALEAAQSNDLARDFAEEAFHQVKPRGGGGGKVQMKTLLACEPSLDSGMLVRGVIVADDMDLFIRSDGGIDFLQEGQPFAVTMPVGRMCQHFAAQVVQCGKESHRPVPVVIMGAGADMALSEGQAGLGALQSLALALLVTAQNHGVVRRVQIKADNVPVFFLELQIVGQLEAPDPVRRNAVRRPKPLNRGFAQSGVSGHLPHTPASAMSGTSGSHCQRFADGLRRDARFAPPACGITKAGKPLPTPTSPPFTHRRHARVEFFGDRLSALSGSQAQYNASAKGLPLGTRRGFADLIPLAVMVSTHDYRSWRWHAAQKMTPPKTCKAIYGTLH